MKIIDQNALRDPVANQLRTYLVSGGNVLISDVAFSEMTKHPTMWHETFKQSTRILSEYPDQVYIARTTGWIYGEELVHGKSSLKWLDKCISKESTVAFRQHLSEIEIENSDFTLKLQKNVRNAQKLADDNYFHGAFNPKYLKNLTSWWKNRLSKESSKRLRSADDVWECMHDVLIESDIEFIVYTELRGVDANEVQAVALIKNKSLIYYLIITMYAYALKWLAIGGIEFAKDKTLQNELADADYVALSLLFDGIISNETDVNSMLKMLCKIFITLEKNDRLTKA